VSGGGVVKQCRPHEPDNMGARPRFQSRITIKSRISHSKFHVEGQPADGAPLWSRRRRTSSFEMSVDRSDHFNNH
jgi:hypothetical protein